MSDFLKALNSLSKAMNSLPIKMGAEAVRFSKERFQQQNWVDNTTENWQPRKVNKGSKQRQNRGVLTDTGRLRRSIRRTRATTTQIVIGTDVAYAQIHNEGGRYRAKQNVKAHQRTSRLGLSYNVTPFTRTINVNMPKRQFLGNSTILANRISRIAAAEVRKALKN